jgi:hypothetical protein
MICRQCFSFPFNHNNKTAEEEVQDLINSITPSCHVHLLHDDLNLPGPILHPMSIWGLKINGTVDKKLDNDHRCRFRRLDVTRVKGIQCVYSVLFLANQTQLFRKKLYKTSKKMYYRNGVISFSFHSVQNCFWADYSIPIPNTKSPSRRLPSSSSYIVFFTPLTKSQWMQMLHSDKDVLTSCPKTGLRFFPTPSKKTEGYFHCSFCTESTPLLVPMSKEDQSNILRFNDFSLRNQYKLWKVSEEIDSLTHDFFTNEEKSKLLAQTREFDSPRLFRLHGLLKDPTSTKRSLDLMILHKLTGKLNATIVLCRFGESVINEFCDRPSLDQSMRRSSIYMSYNKKLTLTDFTDTDVVKGLMKTLRSSTVVLGIHGYKFLTCYHVPSITFRFYVDPFQPELWITFAFTSLVIAVLLHIFVLKYHKSEILHAFHPYFFMLSTITDDSCGMPSTLARQTVVRIGLGPWFLMTVVLVNAYLGLVITGLTSPFPLESVKSFADLTKMHFSPKEIARGLIWSRNYADDLDAFIQAEKECFFDIPKTREFDPEVDFQIYSSLNEMEIIPLWNEISEKYTELNVSAKESFEQVLKSIQAFEKFLVGFAHKKTQLEYFLSAFIDEGTTSLSVDLRRELIAKNNPIYSLEDAVILNLYVPSHIFVPPSYRDNNVNYWNYSFASAVEEELVKCGRTAYADLRSVLEMEHKYLSDRYSGIEFFISEDEIGKEMDSWLFPGMHDGAPLVRAMKALVYTGIYRKLEEYFTKERFVDRKGYSDRLKWKTAEGPTAVSLAGSIQTAFFIFVSAVTICLLALLSEIVWSNRSHISSLIAIIIANICLMMRKGRNDWLILRKGPRRLYAGLPMLKQLQGSS